MFAKRARVRNVWVDYHPRSGGSNVDDARRDTETSTRPEREPDIIRPIPGPGNDPGADQTPFPNPELEDFPLVVRRFDDNVRLLPNLLRGIPASQWFRTFLNEPSSLFRFTNGTAPIVTLNTFLSPNTVPVLPAKYELSVPSTVHEFRALYMDASSDLATNFQPGYKARSSGFTVRFFSEDNTPLGEVSNHPSTFIDCSQHTRKSFWLPIRFPKIRNVKRIEVHHLLYCSGLTEFELFGVPTFPLTLDPPALQWVPTLIAPRVNFLPNLLSGSLINHTDPLTGVEFPDGNKPNNNGDVQVLCDVFNTTHVSSSNIPKSFTITTQALLDIKRIDIYYSSNNDGGIFRAGSCSVTLRLFDLSKRLLITTPLTVNTPATATQWVRQRIVNPNDVYLAEGVKYIIVDGLDDGMFSWLQVVVN